MSLDQDTVVRLLMRENDKLRAYVWLIVRDDHLADDILQELGLLAVRKCGDIKNIEHFLAWSRVAARNIARDLLRKKQHGPLLLSDGALDDLDVRWQQYDSTPPAAIAGALRHCVARLSAYARRLIQLRYGEGLRSAELAQRLGRKVTTIYVALTRTHKKLAECVHNQLAKEGHDE